MANPLARPTGGFSSNPRTIGLKRRVLPKPMKAGLAPRPTARPAQPKPKKASGSGTLKLMPIKRSVS